MRDVPERTLEPPVEWEREPVCPVCGKPCSWVYKRFGIIEGCDNEGEWLDATETEECFDTSMR